MWRHFSLLVLALGMLIPSASPRAQNGLPPDNKPKVEASLVPEQTAVRPGGTVTVALKQIIRKDWHTYWVNPGDSGAPTEVKWHLPDGWKAGAIQWPYPARIPDGPLMEFGYTDKATLLIDVTAPADAKPGSAITLPADVNWLVCSGVAGVCVPEEAKLNLSLGVSDAPPPPDDETKILFAEARAAIPKPVSWRAHFDASGNRFALVIEGRDAAAALNGNAVFYPYKDGYIEPMAPQTWRAVPNGVVLESRFPKADGRANPDDRAKTKDFGGVLVSTAADGNPDAFALSATPGPVPAAPAATLGLVNAALFAFLGGLILNLMPCVLPVLSMKALALAKAAGDRVEARAEALSYGAGVVAAFLSLAVLLLVLRAGGMAVGWGFQLQQPLFVAGLALLMFAVGLNLSGLYEVSAGGLEGVGQSTVAKGGALGSFLTGLLAVVVATPCTAPFMAAALGFAATTSAAAALTIFFALALGFAAPFVVLGFSPAALKFLPRPGPWMIIFRQVLAFPMYGASVWLVWVLSQQVGPDGLFALLGAGLALAFAFWAFGAAERAKGRGHVIGLSAALLGLIVMVVLAARVGESKAQPAATAEAASALHYEPFSAARFAALRDGGQPVFINATAAWCITCLVNEKVALSNPLVAKAFADKGIVALKADWTNQNPEITALLAAYGRSGVPLYLYVPAKGADPVVLPQLLTESIVLAAIAPSKQAD